MTRLSALEVLRRKDEKAYRLIVGTNILEWGQKDYTEYDKGLIRNKKIQEALANSLKKLTHYDLQDWKHTLNFFYFPQLKLDYEKKSSMNCELGVPRTCCRRC